MSFSSFILHLSSFEFLSNQRILSQSRQRVHRSPTWAHRFFDERFHLFLGSQCHFLNRRQFTSRKRRENIVIHHRKIAQNRGERTQCFTRLATARFADHPFRCPGDLNRKMSFAFRPPMRTTERVNRFIEMTLRQISARFGIDRMIHIDHVGEQIQRQGCF